MPAVDVRSRIVNEIERRFKTILTSNGYNLDLGANVFVWRASPFEPGDLPGINIKDTVDTHTYHSANIIEHALTIQAQAIFSTGNTTDETARKAVADIWKAIGVDRTWIEFSTAIRLAQNTDPVKDEVDVAHGAQQIGGAQLTFAVKYRTTAFDPYTIR